MIVADLKNCHRYYSIHPGIQKVLEYIKQTDFSNIMSKRIELEGKRLFINVDEPDLIPRSQQKLEFHRKYIDIQVPFLQSEEMGWADLNNLGKADIEYDETKDYGLYTCPAESYFTVRLGQFAIFFPEDAHAPIIGNGKQRKLIGKVLL